MMLTLLYGLCAWGAACNLPAWARLFWARLRGGHGPKLDDVYLFVRAGIFLGALGLVLLANDRLIAALLDHTPLKVPSWLGFAGVMLLSLAEVLFLRGAAINAHARGAIAWAWRAYWTGAALWVAFVALAG